MPLGLTIAAEPAPSPTSYSAQCIRGSSALGIDDTTTCDTTHTWWGCWRGPTGLPELVSGDLERGARLDVHQHVQRALVDHVRGGVRHLTRRRRGGRAGRRVHRTKTKLSVTDFAEIQFWDIRHSDWSLRKLDLFSRVGVG